MRIRVITTLLLSGLLACPLVSLADGDDPPDCMGTEKENDVCLMEVKDVHPTQFAVGSVAVECKKKRTLEKKSKKKLKKYLAKEKRWVPAVIGPDGSFYITDHHHLSTALYRAKTDKWTGKEQKIHIRVLQNYQGSDTPLAEFWEEMKQQNRAWPYDGEGKPVENYGAKLARMDLGEMEDNPYRTLSRWTRESCGYLKTGKDQCVPLKAGKSTAPFFMEFYWARYLRSRIDLDKTGHSALQKKYPKAIDAVLDKNAATEFFEKQGLNAEDFGQNQEGYHLHLEFKGDSCEQWWLNKNDGA